MRHLFIILTGLLFTTSTFAQTGIGTTTPHASAQLEVSSTTKGLLIPRMTAAQRNAITSAATGLMIYQTDGKVGFYYYNGSSWAEVGATTSATYSIGDFAHGGIVFWVDETGQHGLVCAKEDQSSGIRWFAGSFGHTQAKGDGVYAGKANTAIIIAAQVAIGDDNDTYAARICNELQITEGGTTYGDWYLPSKDELNKMYLKKGKINTTAAANGGSAFTPTSYWSSTEDDNFLAWLQGFDSGEKYNGNKDYWVLVRAVRAF
tara:strand:- start:253 stop:1035 length:783 start_codon:yes stop_codon:yes gene_type:complete